MPDLSTIIRVLKGLDTADALYPKVAPRASKISDNARIVTNEIISNADDPTTVFFSPSGETLAAYQLSARPEGTYLPNLVSYEKGRGKEALEHAYQSAQKRPVHLYAIPGSEGFYRKQPGWEESLEEGVSKFTRKAEGGRAMANKQGRYGPKTHEHARGYTQSESIEDMDRGGLGAIKRGVQRWVPDAVGLPGDIADAVAYAGRKIAQGQSERSVPSAGLGAASRRYVMERMGQSSPRQQAEMTATPETDWREEAAALANPLFFMNPKQAATVLAGVAGVAGGMPMGALGVIKNKGGNWLTGSVEDALRGLKNPYVDRYQAELDRWGTPEQARQWVADPGDKARSLNNWIDKQLTRYVKNEMATPEDPIRALAERGVLHIAPDAGFDSKLITKRGKAGFPGMGMGKAPLAQSWEGLADRAIRPTTALDLSAAERDALFGGKQVDKATQVYGLDPFATGVRTSDLGFNHLIDELSNALNPESGLPRHLLLDPKSLDRVSVPQAVQRVSDINAWRAAQKAEADALRANNAATRLHKEYPVGEYWHGGDYVPGEKLTRPLYMSRNKELAESYVDMAKERTGKGSLQRLSAQPKNPAPEEVVFEEARKLGIDPSSGTPASVLDSELHGEGTIAALMRRLKAKGYDSAELGDIGYGSSVSDKAVVMFPGAKVSKGHDNPLGLRWVELKKGDGVPEGYQLIVDESSPGIPFYQYKTPQGRTLQGGYSEEEARQIAWGQPLSDALKYEGDTMGHCVGGYCDEVLQGRSRIFSLRDAKGQPHVTIETRPGYRAEGVTDEELVNMSPEARSTYDVMDKILQIKGKQNRAPNPEYLPFVQDFVKSGRWSDVGDLQNAGLRKLPDNRYITNAQFDEAIQRLTGEGEPSVNAEWFQRQIRNDPRWWENAKDAFEGYAEGGSVSHWDNLPTRGNWDIFTPTPQN